MIEEKQQRPPHGILLAIVVGLLVLAPSILEEQGEAITEAISELFSPISLTFLPVILLVIIHFLSSSGGSYISSIFNARGPGSIHRGSGAPVGLVLFMIVVLLMLYSRMSMFGGDGKDGGDDE